MKKTFIISAIFIFVFLSGCLEHKSPTTPVTCLPGNLEFESHPCGCCLSSGNYVVNSQAEYDALCGSDDCIGTVYVTIPPFVYTPVDFNTKTLIIMDNGGGSSSYFPHVTGIETDCEAVTVKIRQYNGSIHLTDIINYRQSFTIDKTDLPVNFVVEYYGGP